MVTLDRKDLARYPFLKESQDYIGRIFSSLDDFLESTAGNQALLEAIKNIESALDYDSKKIPPLPVIISDTERADILIAAYPVGRILVSCVQLKPVTDRFVRYQAWVFFSYLQDEEPALKKYIRQSIGLPETGDEVPLADYLSIASRMTDNRWRLINRVVVKGRVLVHSDEYDEIIRERLRYVMIRNLPLKVPGSLCERIRPIIDKIQAEWQKRVLDEFGTIDESAYPPCIRAILAAITGHGHLNHMARFAVTAFLHNIGMNNTRIIEIYGNVPNFDLRKTLYQVEHISGRGGTSVEYTSPLCATMRTHGICVHPDTICSKVTHPLTYYKMKKKEISRNNVEENSETMPSDDNKVTSHNRGDKQEKSGSGISNNITATADYKNKENEGGKISN